MFIMIKAVCYIYLAATTTYPNLNIIERKFKHQILMPDPIILGFLPSPIIFSLVQTLSIAIIM